MGGDTLRGYWFRTEGMPEMTFGAKKTVYTISVRLCYAMLKKSWFNILSKDNNCYGFTISALINAQLKTQTALNWELYIKALTLLIYTVMCFILIFAVRWHYSFFLSILNLNWLLNLFVLECYAILKKSWFNIMSVTLLIAVLTLWMKFYIYSVVFVNIINSYIILKLNNFPLKNFYSFPVVSAVLFKRSKMIYLYIFKYLIFPFNLNFTH